MHIDLNKLAREAMRERGLEPDFPSDVLKQVENIAGAPSPDTFHDNSIRGLRGLLWASVDNDDSRDLDQLSYAQELPGGVSRVYVAIADVDTLVKSGSPADRHARKNTTSVYTAGGIFPMLPEEFSTDYTSLNEHEVRLAIVIQYDVLPDGTLGDQDVYRAWVENKARLAYNSVAAWLDGVGEMPEPMEREPGIDRQMRLQDSISKRLRKQRHERGALDLDTIEARAVVIQGKVTDLKREEKNRAKEMIEDLMIAANQVTARFLESKGFATIRRLVKTPARWEKIMALAAQYGEQLPSVADAPALERFLTNRRAADPLRFPDISLAVVKMMGKGEYSVQAAGEDSTGHFGLAVRDYTHSTAPNRRFPDVITQRMIKEAVKGLPSPYSIEELSELAKHCTRQEDAAHKVERQVRKSAAALLLLDKIGDKFDALVTGASSKGTYVRVLHPPVEGRIIQNVHGLDVGDRVEVKLVSVDVRKGFIDFARVT